MRGWTGAVTGERDEYRGIGRQDSRETWKTDLQRTVGVGAQTLSLMPLLAPRNPSPMALITRPSWMTMRPPRHLPQAPSQAPHLWRHRLHPWILSP